MTKPKKTELEKLQAVWYKKLEEEGFSDIEQADGNLKVWSTRFFSRQPLEVWQAKEAYYNMAERFSNEYKFATELEATIWAYHANAISIRDIVKLINKTGVEKKLNRTSVWGIIKRLETVMKSMYMAGFDESEEQ